MTTSPIVQEALANTYASKWFMLALGPENMHKMLSGFEDKSTQAVCTFAYSEGPGHEPIIFQGRTDVRLPGMSHATL